MDEILPFMMGAITLCIPIVAILTHHQRKMAEIIHARHQASPELISQVEALRRELADLRHLVHQHVIAADGKSNLGFRDAQAASTHDAPAAPQAIQQ